MGFARCSWNPASSTCCLSSSRASAVSAAAGIDAARRVERTDASNERVPILVWHGDVRQQHIDVFALQRLERLRGRLRGQHHGVTAGEMRGDDLTALVVVVHHQDRQALQRRARLVGREVRACWRRARGRRRPRRIGRRTANVAP